MIARRNCSRTAVSCRELLACREAMSLLCMHVTVRCSTVDTAPGLERMVRRRCEMSVLSVSSIRRPIARIAACALCPPLILRLPRRGPLASLALTLLARVELAEEDVLPLSRHNCAVGVDAEMGFWWMWGVGSVRTLARWWFCTAMRCNVDSGTVDQPQLHARCV